MDAAGQVGEPQEFQIPDAVMEHINRAYAEGSNLLSFTPYQWDMWCMGQQFHLEKHQSSKLAQLIREHWGVNESDEA